MICRYLFFNNGFKFEDYVCNDLTMLCLNISNITIITVKNVDYHCIIHNNSKSETINLLQSGVLGKRSYMLKNCHNFQSTQDRLFLLFFCLVYIKWLILSTTISL